MLTEQDKKHPDYTRYINGFNKGYLLAEALPELAASLATIKSGDPWISGMRDGREEFLNEKTKAVEKPKETEVTKEDDAGPLWKKSPLISRFFDRDKEEDKGAGASKDRDKEPDR